jgi:putative hydrolase of the HAD superfamily
MFDFGGVICTPQPQEDLAALAGAAGVSVAELWDAYWPARPAYDAGDLTSMTYWQGVAGQFGRTFSEAQVAELIRLDIASWAHLCEDTVQLIRDLQAAGQRLALLSNMPADVARSIAALPVARHFEHLLFSCDFRALKPDPGCYARALSRLGAPAAEVIFIDDRTENVIGAERMGIRAIHFTGSREARADLAGMIGVHGLLFPVVTTRSSWVLAEKKLSVRS